MGHYSVIESPLIAHVDGDGNPFVLVVDLDENLWRFQTLDFLLQDGLRWLFHHRHHRLRVLGFLLVLD